MRLGWLTIQFFFLLFVASCGLETVSTLTKPNVNFLDQTMVLNFSLSIIYSQNDYNGTDFQGYQVYYKIYPGATSDFSRLAADRDSVNLSPTVNQLINLGYFQMTQSASSGPPIPVTTPLIPLLIRKPASDGVKITLDFTLNNYQNSLSLPSSGTYPQPQLEFNGVAAGVPNLFRSSILAGNALESFTSLTYGSNSTTQIDMSAVSASPYVYEINVFIVAYGLSPTLQAIYSAPVPWGVIRSPNYSY